MIKTHNKTGLKYLCKCKNRDPIKYRGSGIRWSNHLAVHGKDDFSTEIIKEFKSNLELSQYATKLSEDLDVANSEQFANLVPETGGGGSTVGSNATKGRRWSEESKLRLSRALRSSDKMKNRNPRPFEEYNCRYCNKKISSNAIKQHERVCFKNPSPEIHYLSQKFLYHGKQRTLQQIEKLTGVTVSSLRQRIYKGESLEQAASYPTFSPEIIENSEGWQGTVNQLADEFQLSKKSVRSLVKKDFSGDEIILFLSILREGDELRCNECDKLIKTSRGLGYHFHRCKAKTKERHHNEKIITYRSIEMTIQELSEESSIDYNLLLGRISKGKTPEEAVALGESQKKKYFYGGEYLSLTGLAIKSGISIGALRYRIFEKRESVETATSYPDWGKIKHTFQDRELFLTEISKLTGISIDALYYRVNELEQSIEEATSYPTNAKNPYETDK